MSPLKKTQTLWLNWIFHLQDKDNPGEDGGATAGETDSAGGDTARVLEAILSCQTTLMMKIEEVKVDISFICQDPQKLWKGVKTSDTRLSGVEDAIPPLQTVSNRMQLQISQLMTKQEDMENRIRRCNLRFIGLPECAKGKQLTTFLEQLLITTYGRKLEPFSPTLAVDIAHCMPAGPPPHRGPLPAPL